jgi:hypothetical protein
MPPKCLKLRLSRHTLLLLPRGSPVNIYDGHTDKERMSPVVFLDFDDVLAIHPLHNGYRVLDAFAQAATETVPELWANVFDAAARRNLQALHDEFKPRYVISSSWASYLDQSQVSEVLTRTNLEFVGASLSEHWCTPRAATSGRLSEIEAWLELDVSMKASTFVIIDDHMSGQALAGSWLEDRTVFCDAWVGFTHAKLRTARKILNRPGGRACCY